jgi:hypothetical protein
MRYGIMRHGTAELSLRAEVRDAQFHQLFPTLGLLNVGWLALARGLYRRERGAAFDGLLAAVGLAGVLIWVSLVYGPGTTIVHRGSYTDVLLLMTSLAGALLRWSGRFGYGLLAAHTAVFLAVWVCAAPTGLPSVRNDSLVFVAAGAFVLLAGVALSGWDRYGRCRRKRRPRALCGS